MKEVLPRGADDAEQVIRRYADMVYRLAFARMGTKYDADEVFQEGFLRYCSKHPQFHEEEHRRAWLLRVTLTCCSRMWRAPWRHRAVVLETEPVWEMPEDSGLYHALQQLPPKYREVIHLFYYEDMSTAQLAQILHRRESTVRSQLTRARAMLRRSLSEEENDVSRTLSAYEPSDRAGQSID